MRFLFDDGEPWIETLPWPNSGKDNATECVDNIDAGFCGGAEEPEEDLAQRVEDAALDAARRTATFQRFLAFAQFPLWRITPAPEIERGKRVELFDMRFGTPAEPGFMTRALLNSQGIVVSTSFQFGVRRPR